MYRKSVIIINEGGFHTHQAQRFTTAAKSFSSKITIWKSDSKPAFGASAKSLIAVMALGLEKGTEITISAEGEDETAAVDALAFLVERLAEQET